MEIGQIGSVPLLSCPSFQMPYLESQFAQGQAHLAHVGLAGAFAQVFSYSGTEGFFSFFDGLSQALQRLNAAVYILCYSGGKIFPLHFYDSADFHCCPLLSFSFGKAVSVLLISLYIDASSLTSIRQGTGYKGLLSLSA